jgi:hypothetical protein
MSIIVAILLYVFGLDPATGKLNFKCDDSDTSTNTKGGNLIYTSTIKTPKKTVKYVDVSYSDTPSDQNNTNEQVAPFWSSDPQYE